MSNIIRVCTQKILPLEVQARAHLIAGLENPLHRFGTASAAMMINKRWSNGRILNVVFLDGDNNVHKRVEPYFHEWEKYANITFRFIINPMNADVRVTFQPGESWSYVGTDCLLAQYPEPTMGLGWIDAGTIEDEVRRVVLHEVGHTVGFEHELQQPGANFQWNKPLVTAFYEGPPNNWSEEEIEQQVYRKLPDVNIIHSVFDRDSIMAYWTPPDFDLNGKGVPMNNELSITDKKLASFIYPKNLASTTPSDGGLTVA